MFRQMLYFACYALAAMAIAMAVPRYIPDIPPIVTWIAGAVVFLAGALIHETAVRRHVTSRDLRRMVLLHRAFTQNRYDLERMAHEVAQLQETVEAMREAGVTPRSTVSETAIAGSQAASEPAGISLDQESEEPEEDAALASEIKMLHALVRQLYAPVAQDRNNGSAAVGTGPGAESDDAGDWPKGAADEYASQETLDAVRDALRQNRVDLYLQPIVTLPQRKRRYFDCSIQLRSRRDEPIPRDRYASIIDDSGLTRAVGDMVLFRTIQSLRATFPPDHSTAFFCHVPPGICSDRDFFRDFLAYLESCEDLPPTLVLAIAEIDLAHMDTGDESGIGALAAGGVQLCLCAPASLELDVQGLTERGVRYVMLGASTLVPASAQDDEAERVQELKQVLDQAGIDLIVGEIDSEQTLIELLDFNIDFGQGPLFGEPQSSKDALDPAVYPDDRPS